MAATLATQKRVGKEIVAARRKELDEEHIHVEKRTDIGKDAISLLMKANLAPDLRDDQRLTEDEILGQIGTLVSQGDGSADFRCLLVTRRRRPLSRGQLYISWNTPRFSSACVPRLTQFPMTVRTRELRCPGYH